MIHVRKANGKRVPFSEEQVIRSMQRAKIPSEFHKQVLDELKETMYDGIPTGEIYQHIRNFFQKTYPTGACAYSLKQAIMELGPSGYPFENYVAALLEHRGFSTQVGTVVQGKCVTHEVDVVAEKHHEHFMIECKFHNQSGTRSDVKVALYVQARYQDILQGLDIHETTQHNFHQGWLITNTKCTTDAIQYARCSGLNIVSWDYPQKGSLRDWIEEARLYPITSLCSLSFSEKQELLRRKIVLVKALANNSQVLHELFPEKARRELLQKEIDGLLSSTSPMNL